MSQDTIPVSTMGKEEDLNWKEINDALERIANAQNALKYLGVSLPSVARATTLASMNLHLVEAGGDPFKAMTIITEFMYDLWISVCKNLQESMGEAIKSGKVQGQKLSVQEIDSMKALVVNIEMILSTNHSFTAKDIADILEAQQALAVVIDSRSKSHDPLAVARALIVMAQQYMFFDMQGDLIAAKTAFADQQHLLWDIAAVNAQYIIKTAVEQSDSGLPEGKAN